MSPRPARLVVEADGGSRGNPGPAGYGAVVRDGDTGELLAERAARIGTATNNVAEYRGLLAGLCAATEFPSAALDVRMDSKLVVEQMSGRWKVKHPALQPLAREAQRLVRALPPTTFTWIPREQNGHADRLANEAMDGRFPAEPSEPAAQRAPDPAGTSWTPRVPKLSTFLLRHGQTPHSADRRFSGRNDKALTALGERQAAAAGRRLRGAGIGAILSSPLPRTRQTAAIVAETLGVPVRTDDDLMETDFGRWDGMTLAEAAAAYPAELAAWTRSASVAPPGGESFAEVERRVRRARARILAATGTAGTLVVSHVTPIKLLLAAALGAPLDVLFRIHLDPAGLSTVDWYDDGSASVRLVNDTSHLG